MASRRSSPAAYRTAKREPLLWVRKGQEYGTLDLTSGAPQAQVELFRPGFIDVGIDARRTVRKLIVNILGYVIATVANELVQVIISILKTKAGLAASAWTPQRNTDSERATDLMAEAVFQVCTVANVPIPLPGGRGVSVEVSTMRKLENLDSVILHAQGYTGGGYTNLSANVHVYLQPRCSALVQRTTSR